MNKSQASVLKDYEKYLSDLPNWIELEGISDLEYYNNVIFKSGIFVGKEKEEAFRYFIDILESGRRFTLRKIGEALELAKSYYSSAILVDFKIKTMSIENFSIAYLDLDGGDLSNTFIEDGNGIILSSLDLALKYYNYTSAIYIFENDSNLEKYVRVDNNPIQFSSIRQDVASAFMRYISDVKKEDHHEYKIFEYVSDYMIEDMLNETVSYWQNVMYGVFSHIRGEGFNNIPSNSNDIKFMVDEIPNFVFDEAFKEIKVTPKYWNKK